VGETLEELEELAEPERPEAVPELTAPEPPEAAPRRRRRTLPLIGAAVALGVVAGACTGYLIQANRAATRLPSLSQATLAQGKGTVEPLSAAQDRRVKTDGDLRKLLLARPKGAQAPYLAEGHDGWMGLAEYAENFERPDGALSQTIADEFRRAAVTGWRTDNTYSVTIRLVQYRQYEALAAKTNVEDSATYATQDNDNWVIPGTGDGLAYVFKGPVGTSGGAVYGAEAHAWRGDIELQMWVFGTKPVPKATIMDLATRQMERL
jgi:hypothetical protein